jgi:hypothetical protein
MSEIVVPYEPGARLKHYPKVLQLGEPRLLGFLDGVNVIVQEKLDGSQFRFGKIGDKLVCGSHRIDYSDAVVPDGYFRKAADYIQSIADLVPNDTVFFGELLDKPKHNTIVYAKTPTNGIMLFDQFNLLTERWATPPELMSMAVNLDIDPPNVLESGPQTKESLTKLMSGESYLGGAIMEGVVVKNYDFLITGPESPAPHPAFGKYVRASFKEENQTNWKEQKDVVGQIVARYRTVARFEKAAQHLQDDNKLTQSMKDMALLIPELETDFETECKNEVLEMLWQRYRRDIVRSISAGLAEWYKTKLFNTQ